MTIFNTILNIAILAICALFIRHSLARARYFLQMLQQHGYKTHEYRGWILNNFSTRAITTEHVLFNVVIFAFIYSLAQMVTYVSGVVIMFVFTLFWFGSLSRYRPEKDKKPLVFTPRVIRLSVTLAVILLPIYYYLGGFIFSVELFYMSQAIEEPVGNYLTADPYFLAFLLCLIDIFVPFLIFPAAWLMKPVERAIQNGFKKQARNKLASMPHLKVVAITGSYGKTSTKFVIDAFLKERMSVCVTPGSYNTPMGICKVINNDLEATHQVLILEMGARYEGNIKELCDIARPDISVVTNVGLAHLETFGSQEAVAREKATLARELKPGGTLILNGGDPIVRKMGDNRTDIKRVITGEDSGQIWADQQTVNRKGTSFTLHIREDGSETTTPVNTPLLGDHNIQNMVQAAAVARLFDIRPETIAVAASRMEPVEHRLELKQQGDLTVIDDAFNSNPVGAKNAVEILASFQTGNRIIITPGMIELGDLEEEKNREFGKQIGASGIELAILVGKERTKPIYEGIMEVKSGSKPELKVVSTLFDANEELQKYARPGDVVLYENDLPDSYNEG